MTDRELMQQALDALINAKGYIFYNVLDDKGNRYDTAIEALRARLAQPEPEELALLEEAMIEAWKPIPQRKEEPEPEELGEIIPADEEQLKRIAKLVEPEPVAWRDRVEQRLLTWRQSFVNRSGDQLALDDFMDKQSLDDLIDFVCDEYTAPPQRKEEPEPVAWADMEVRGEDKGLSWVPGHFHKTPLYTAPPKREFVGLTDDDINDHWITAMWNTEGTRLPIPEFARAIEAKLKEKNNG